MPIKEASKAKTFTTFFVKIIKLVLKLLVYDYKHGQVWNMKINLLHRFVLFLSFI